MKLILKALRNPYLQWAVLIAIFGVILWLGIESIIAEDKVLNGK